MIRKIWGRLDQLIEGDDAAVLDLASQIHAGGNARVILDGCSDGEDNSAWKGPDGQLCFGGTLQPPFVTEVGYSQDSQDLATCAKIYHEKSGGEIKTVSTIKVEYADRVKREAAGQGTADIDCSAYFSAHRGPNRVEDDVFSRDAQGEMAAGGPLRLLLSDFIPDHVLETKLSEQVRRRVEAIAVDVTFGQLCRALRDGERPQELIDSNERQRKQERETGQQSKKREAVHVHWEVKPGNRR